MLHPKLGESYAPCKPKSRLAGKDEFHLVPLLKKNGGKVELAPPGSWAGLRWRPARHNLVTEGTNPPEPLGQAPTPIHESTEEIHRRQPAAVHRRADRVSALPQRVGAERAQKRHGRLRPLARRSRQVVWPQVARAQDWRPPDRHRRHAAPAQQRQASLSRVRPLRRSASRAARAVGEPAIRADASRPQPLRARRQRQQGPALRPPQGGRGVSQDRHRAAVRLDVRRRGRGGGRRRGARRVSQAEQTRTQVRRRRGF